MSPISSFSQPIHSLAIEVCRVLQANDYQAFIVGGCVRDLYLGLTPKDWDITTNATPKEVMALFERTIPTGLQHGTVTVCMDEGVENHFEVTTFRVEGKYQDGRRPEEVRFVGNLIEDLARRDLTINAIAYDPIRKIILDPFYGARDIKANIIRAVGDPNARFQEDGLRIMRAARFAARFGYQIELKTMEGMKTSLDTLKKVSKERISDELCKTLMTNHPSDGLTILINSGALDIVCPLLAGRMLPKMELQDDCKGDLETRIAFLYNKLPSKLVEKELIQLKLSNKEIKKVMFLLDALPQYEWFSENASVSAYRHFIARFKNHAPDDWEHTLRQFITFAGALQLPITLLSQYQTTVFARKDLAIDGNDLMAIGIRPGPSLKSLLDSCYHEILECPEHNNKSYLLRFVTQL